ncbi:transglutaminase family protein [Acetobacter orientalis]|uniref:transglutaminase family protein n=1 Tax=Acetobacter orientalis TaxID=146474 RepID=UPI0039EAE454
MSSYVLLRHHTCYRYDRPVSLGPQTIRLKPMAVAQPYIQTYALHIAPPYTTQTWQHDVHGNTVAQVIFDERVTFFDITIELEADLTPRDPFAFDLHTDATVWQQPEFGQQSKTMVQPFYAHAPANTPLHLYQDACHAGARCERFLAHWLPTAPTQTVAMLVALNKAVAAHVGYQLRMEPGVWSPEETLAKQSGSCRDSAWLLVALLRRMGFVARFVSGYLIQNTQSPNGEDVLTCDLHAWAETYLPGAGWVGFDTTSGLLTAQAHVALAASPTPEDAAPVSGLLDHCEATFDVSMQAERLFLRNCA